MAADFSAPWDAPFAAGSPAGGAVGFTEPANAASASVPSAAQAAPAEAGAGPEFDHDTDVFGTAGVTAGAYIDTTAYQPPGVGPSVPWDAPPRETNKVRGIDHGASRAFNHEIPADTGVMTTRDRPVPSWEYGIATDGYGRKVLTDIGRPEHDMYQYVQHDLSPRWNQFQDRPQFGNIAVPAPYIQAVEPGEGVPNAAYPDLSRNAFAAEIYATPPDPSMTVPGYATYSGEEWES